MVEGHFVDRVKLELGFGKYFSELVCLLCELKRTIVLIGI